MMMLFAFTEQVEAGGQAAAQGVEVHTNPFIKRNVVHTHPHLSPNQS